MKPALKLVAVLATAALLGQPLGAAPICWQDDGSKASCPACPMSHEPTKPTPVKAEATDPGCCQITSSAPAPAATTVKIAGLSRTQLAAPVVSPMLLSNLGTSAPVFAAAPDARTTGSSLNVLYCVFLI